MSDTIEVFKAGELLDSEDHQLVPENLFSEDAGNLEIESESGLGLAAAARALIASESNMQRRAIAADTVSASAPDSNVLPTVFYVNMIPDPPPKLRKELQEMKQAVLDTRTFATGVAEKTVQAKIDQGNFISDGKLDQIAVASYRTKCHEFALRQKVNWLAAGSEIRQKETFTDTPGGLHSRIVTLALKDFSVNKAVYDQFEGLIGQIVESISRTGGYKGTIQYMVFLTIFRYDEIARTVDPKLRLLAFRADAQTYEVTRRKHQTTKMATLTMEFAGIDWDFNLVRFDKVWPTIEKSIIEEGKRNSDPNTIVDIPI